jgi:hypothetical protein
VITVGRLAPAGCWDAHFLELLWCNRLYPTGLDFKVVDGYPNTSGCILEVPGQYWFEHVLEINAAIRRYEWLLLIKTGDEADLFDLNAIEHANVRFWCQTPRIDRDHPECRFLPLGWPPHFDNLPAEPPLKQTGVFLAGQKTHERRFACFGELQRAWLDKRLHMSFGFTEGLPQHEYVEGMLGAKVAPAPSGAVAPDSFRLYEALEAHCVPIADDVSPAYDSRGYWRTIFDNPPFPVLVDEKDWPGYCKDQIGLWPANANRVAAWWFREKRRIALNLRDDLEALGAL